MSRPRDLILAATVDAAGVPLDGFPGAFIRKISIDELDQIADQSRQGLHLIAKSLMDENGDPLFTADDVAELGKLKVAVFRSIRRQVEAVNRLTDEATDTLAKKLTSSRERRFPLQARSRARPHRRRVVQSDELGRIS